MRRLLGQMVPVQVVCPMSARPANAPVPVLLLLNVPRDTIAIETRKGVIAPREQHNRSLF